MPRRLIFLAAGLSLSLIACSGCQQWDALGFRQDVAGRDELMAKSDLQRYSDDDGFPEDHQSTDQFQLTDAQDLAPSQRNETTKNDFLLGRRAEDAGQLESAQQLYQNVLRTHPTHAHAHHRLGVVADKMQRYAEAERHYQSALHYMEPENHQEISIIFSDLGYSYLLRGDFKRSERALTNALTYDENSRIAKRNLALLHGYRGDFERAYQTFASVGGDAQARAELDRLFPHWQEQSGQTADPSGSTPAAVSVAAVETPQATRQSSTAFPTSRPPSNDQFPQATPRGSSSLGASQHLTFSNGSPTAPENATAADSTPPAKFAADRHASIQPLEAPSPANQIASAIPDQYPVSTVRQPVTAQPVAPPAGTIMQVAYAEEPPRAAQQPAGTTAEFHQTHRPTGLQVDGIRSETSRSASRTALVLGGAIGPGGMFPTSQINLTAATPRYPDTSQLPITVTQEQRRSVPASDVHHISAPAGSPMGPIRSPSESVDRTELIPTHAAPGTNVVPLRNDHQSSYQTPGACIHAYSSPRPSQELYRGR